MEVGINVTGPEGSPMWDWEEDWDFAFPIPSVGDLVQVEIECNCGEPHDVQVEKRIFRPKEGTVDLLCNLRYGDWQRCRASTATPEKGESE